MFRFLLLSSVVVYTGQAFIMPETCSQETQVQPDPNFDVNVLLNVNWFVQLFYPIGQEESATCEKVNFATNGNNLQITQSVITAGQKITLNNLAVPNGQNGRYRLQVNAYNASQTNAPFVVLHAASDMYIAWACMTPNNNNNGLNSDQALYVATPNGTPLTTQQVTSARNIVESNGLSGNLDPLDSNPQANSNRCNGINA